MPLRGLWWQRLGSCFLLAGGGGVFDFTPIELFDDDPIVTRRFEVNFYRLPGESWREFDAFFGKTTGDFAPAALIIQKYRRWPTDCCRYLVFMGVRGGKCSLPGVLRQSGRWSSDASRRSGGFASFATEEVCSGMGVTFIVDSSGWLKSLLPIVNLRGLSV